MRKGFTLIELLLVVVIIGILAALALPKFGDVKSRSYKASMASDLRNLATSEALYQADNNTYSSSTSAIGFQPSTGNVIAFPMVAADSFRASASHSGVSYTCTIAYGGPGSNTVVCT
jgi:type IV pilus assembly protein PilA